MRAVESATSGYVERDGVKLFWEQFGDGEPTVAMLPTWAIVHSRQWKFQVPYLARHHRVISFDGRGCGRSDRPIGPEHYTPIEFAADTLAVLDATGTERAMLVTFSCGSLWALQLAADHPDRVLGIVAISPAVPLLPLDDTRNIHAFDEPIEATDGWAKYNRHYWNRDYAGFLDFFIGRWFTEPHSTKATEDGVGWGLEIDASTLADAHHGLDVCGRASTQVLCARVHRPVLVIHGTDDAIRPYAAGAALAELTCGALVTVEGAGHAPHLRDPVHMNQVIKRFVDTVGR
jgi:pimeloyl-ACP methyl ester carboxylesterase